MNSHNYLNTHNYLNPHNYLNKLRSRRKLLRNILLKDLAIAGVSIAICFIHFDSSI